MRWRGYAIPVLVLVLAPWVGAAQDVEDLDLPVTVADEIIDFFNAPTTLRFQGRAEVPAGETIRSDVAVLLGPIRVGGLIEGDVVVVNGDLVIEPGGRVTGDVTVLGGTATAPPGTVGGRLAIFDEALPYTRRGERIVYDDTRRRGERRWDYEGASTRSRLSLRVEDSYNRVEGMPVRVGPVVETRGDNRLRLDALAVWRTDRSLGFEPGEMGWFLRLEQHVGREGRFSVGGTAHSLVTPIERWGLADVEASLTTFLFHRDYRDYYEREGFSAFARYQDRDAGVRLTAEYRDEDHRYAPVGSPWTLSGKDDPWRPQPLVGEGSFRSVVAELVVDDRNDPEDPTDGWYLEGRGTFGIDGSLTLPEYRLAEGPATLVQDARALNTDVRTGFLDLRRHARLGPSSDVRLRGIVAGSLNGDPLPPQFQHALGGEGSLPGYRRFALDCGARTRPFSVFRAGTEERLPVFAGYGCDRVALFQIEYRGSFSIDIDVDDDWNDDWGDDWYPAVDLSPRWSVFLNSGKGWVVGDGGTEAFPRQDTERFTDVGFGFFLGDLGLYWAYPLQGEDRGLNFFVRLDHRF